MEKRRPLRTRNKEIDAFFARTGYQEQNITSSNG
jgi:hypothetical protein